MLTSQLQALPAEQAQTVLRSLDNALRTGSIGNPVGWLLTVMKRAREGKLFVQPGQTGVPATVAAPARRPTEPEQPVSRPVQPASPAHVRNVVSEIRQQLNLAKYHRDGIS
ncbi:helix-turn-helix domain protein [Xenorhabdus innexi]|nr:helix-turn-helix domain protein [Xenorhabdus innexi]